MKYNDESKRMFQEWHNEVTCKLWDKIKECNRLGNYSKANQLYDTFQSLDAMAKTIGVLQYGETKEPLF